MPPSPGQSYRPSPEAVAILCERLQRMGVSMSESGARSLLEAVLAFEGPRLDALTRGSLQASLEAMRNTADAALRTLTGAAVESPRRDYELSFPPAPDPVTASGQRRRAAPPRPVAARKDERPDRPDEDGPRPVFKRRRGR
jgi:hypothetical protein